MKVCLISFLIFAVFICNIIAQDSTKVIENSGKLTLNILGFENDEGKVKIALSNSEEDYTKKGKPFRAVSVIIENKKANFVFYH